MKFIFFSVRVVQNVGKIEIVLKKKENTSWECLGCPLENHNSLIPKKDTGMLCCYFKFRDYEIVLVKHLFQSVEGHFGRSERALVCPTKKLKCVSTFFFLFNRD